MLRYVGIALGVLLILLVLMSAYTIHETEQAIITQFGKPIGGPITEPGLHFRIPLIQVVKRFDKRTLQWDGAAEQIVTHDKKYIYIDTMARWRIEEPLLFLQAVQDETGAQSRLDDIIDGAVRDVISNNPLIELVRTSNRSMQLDISEAMTEDSDTEATSEMVNRGREALAQEIRDSAVASAKDLGIELLDVRIKSINYVQRVLDNVYQRMISERQRIATRFRSEGLAEGQKIRGQLERDLKEITSEAFRTAEEIRGRADAEAAAIYAEAYSKDQEFYTFLKTLESYETALINGDVTLVLSSNSEFFELLKDQGEGTSSN